MEGLVLLLGELVATLLVPAIGALAAVVVAVVEVATELVGWVLSRAVRRARDAGVDAPGAAGRPSGRRRWVRRGLRIGGLLAAALLLLVLIADLFFFAPIVSLATDKIADRTGIAITFGTADGSLWTGRARLADARFVRSGHATSDFDLRAAEAEIDLSMWHLLFLRPRLESVTGRGITGEHVRTGVADRLESRRPFHCGRLELASVDLTFRDLTRRRPVEARVELSTFAAAPFRSDHALFDVLFRARVDGRIDGYPIAIASHEIEGGRQTRWTGDAIPLAVIAPYLPGPLAWIDRGTVDVDVRDRWAIDGPAEIHLDVKLDFAGLHVAMPDGLSLKQNALALPIVKWLNRRERALPLHFSLAIDPQRFEGRASPEAAGLFDAIADAVARALADRTGIQPDSIKSLGRKTMSRVKAFIDRRRKE